jgi:hypothetical protein
MGCYPSRGNDDGGGCQNSVKYLGKRLIFRSKYCHIKVFHILMSPPRLTLSDPPDAMIPAFCPRFCQLTAHLDCFQVFLR